MVQIASPSSGITTDSDILDLAMVALGEKLYSEMTTTDDTYRAVNKIYALKRDAMLAEHPWNGCVTMALLVTTGQIPLFDWSFEYIYPADALRILRLDTESDPWEIGWDGIGLQKSIWCNLSPANCRYIFRNLNVATYSSFLVDVLAARIAMELAQSVTAHQGKFQMLAQVYKETLMYAKKNDGQEQSPTVVLSTSLTTDVRTGG